MLKRNLFRHLSNIPGWCTRRNLVVLESDDWGSIRMPSNEVFSSLIMSDIDLRSEDSFIFNKYDSLATSDDLSSLFEVLYSVKDSKLRPAVMTPLALVANPDFKRIQQSDFKEYFYEPFTDTLKKYPGCEDSFSIWKQGIQNKLFIPQFHGREHLNVKVWMKALINNNLKARKAFDYNMWGISTGRDPDIGVDFQAAFDFADPNDLKNHEEIITSGLKLFENLFGYRAVYFVPPNGPISSKLEPLCTAEGVRYLSTPKIQTEPLGLGRKRKRFHWLGQKNKTGLIYLTRNCYFEPVQPGQDWIDSCLKEISIAFKWHKPAIISSHRVNYIGSLYKDNRSNGLKQLESLFKSILKIWPKTEFITSAELGEIIRNG